MDRLSKPARCGIGMLLACLVGWIALGAAAEKVAPGGVPVATLIRQLGDREYAVREQAQSELARLGFDAFEALEEAASHEDPEIARRARFLLRQARRHFAHPSDPPEVQNLLSGYDLLPLRERMQRVRQLAAQPGGAGVAALCRLVKYEKALVVSNWAGLEILDHEPVDAAARAHVADILRRELTGSRRPAARWLLAYLRLREDPKGALADWARVVDAERSALLRAPDDTSPAIVATLMYHLAQAYAEQGQNDLAEKTAEQARQLSPGNDPQRLEAHLQTAWSLRRRGLFRWAEAEFRRVAGAGLPVATVLANNALAEMFHDQGNHQAAAEALRGAIEVFTEKRIRQEELAGRRRHEMVARMHYFLACHAKEQGDQANHVQHLEDALRADPTEVDALIAFYRLPDATPEQRKRADRLVERAAAMMKEQILEEPDDANHYNQYAWLVGNTKGDLDEALKFSRKSLELSPNNGAYLDTLAHVHFARGELEEAVRVQTKAIEMEPHSGLLVKELEVFKAALEAKKNAGAKKP